MPKKPKPKFELFEGGDGKVLYVHGPKNFPLEIEIDHDDVDHSAVDKAADKLIQLLEKHWK